RTEEGRRGALQADRVPKPFDIERIERKHSAGRATFFGARNRVRGRSRANRRDSDDHFGGELLGYRGRRSAGGDKGDQPADRRGLRAVLVDGGEASARGQGGTPADSAEPRRDARRRHHLS